MTSTPDPGAAWYETVLTDLDALNHMSFALESTRPPSAAAAQYLQRIQQDLNLLKTLPPPWQEGEQA